MYDDMANKYQASKVYVGRKCGGSAADIIIPGVSIKVSAYFKETSPQAFTGILEMRTSHGKVILRNISLK
ncbi:MAG: hypothetical protein DRP81_08900 [Candidatus Omnitrophota bacterium]|nr:MAG: hypothetical protein DRP81_08900 [Candidatus Omnitrophota bacterium]